MKGLQMYTHECGPWILCKLSCTTYLLYEVTISLSRFFITVLCLATFLQREMGDAQPSPTQQYRGLWNPAFKCDQMQDASRGEFDSKGLAWYGPTKQMRRGFQTRFQKPDWTMSYKRSKGTQCQHCIAFWKSKKAGIQRCLDKLD